MTDDELKAHIDLHLRSLKAGINILNAKVDETKKVDLIGSGITVKNFKKQAEERIQKNLESLPYYIYEATIRGFNYIEQLQSIHERKSKSTYFSGMDIELLDSAF